MQCYPAFNAYEMLMAKIHLNLSMDVEIRKVGERLAYQHRRSFSAFVEDLILEKQQAIEQGKQTLPYDPSQPSKGRGKIRR